METKNNYIDRLYVAMRENAYNETEIRKCCEYASALLSKGLPVLFDDHHVQEVLHLNKINLNDYHSFPLHQLGKIREITAPSVVLKQRQKWILNNILNRADVSNHAHGFIANRSIKTNALAHIKSDYALCIDIKDFFPSISRKSVYSAFLSLGYSSSASSKLADVCCYKDKLPQGASTSPYLSNIVFKPVDEEISTIAKSNGIIYTRYADDLTFSADHSLDNILPEVERILSTYGFQINRDKVHFYKPGFPKKITGLVVQNGVVRIPKQFKRKLRQEIYYCTKYGVLTHLENVNAQHYVNYREYLYGKAYYVHMIEPEVGSSYLDALDNIEWL